MNTVKKLLALAIICLSNGGWLMSQPLNIDGHNYKTVTIGKQTWLAENLAVSKFRNGEAIMEAKTSEDWIKAADEGKPAWCYYNNDPANGTQYGKLYNWYAIIDPRGLAPKGWHLPSDEEWTTLTNQLGGENIAGTKMKSKELWSYDGNGTNESGFSALPGGIRGPSSFGALDIFGYWWSSSETDPTGVWVRSLKAMDGIVYREDISKKGGYSARCLKD